MIYTVPVGMSPSDLSQKVRGPDVCDLTAGPRLQPSGWVNVRIVPNPDAAAPTPDNAGRLAHLLVEFARPPVRNRGKRRQTIQQFATDPPFPGAVASVTGQSDTAPLYVETDPGTYWFSTEASLWLVGGTEGDSYLVTASACVPRDEDDEERYGGVDAAPEPPFAFELTTYWHAESVGVFSALPTPPRWHTHFWAVSALSPARLTASAIPLAVTSYGPSARLPLVVTPSITTGIYKTGGSF